MLPRTGRLVAFGCVALPVAACGGEGERRSAASVRTDSAGVEVVELSIDEGAAPVFATIDAAPEIRLGSLDGRAEEQFGRVTDVRPLSDGGLAVLDGLTAEVRLFDADGAHRATLGSKGAGPGEFESPISLGLLSGDTLAVYDAQRRRVTLFGPDGGLGQVVTLQDTRSRIIASSFLPDGRLVGQSIWISEGGGPPPMGEAVLLRDTTVLTVFAPNGAVDDTIDVIPGRELVTRIDRSGDAISVLRRPPAFGRSSLFAARSGGMWSAANDRFELRLLSLPAGEVIRIVRVPDLERPITDELFDRIVERAMSSTDTPALREATETWLSLSPRPETRPAFDRLRLDDGGNLWVREWSAPDPSARWWVLAEGGDLLGAVEIPPGLEVMAIDCRSVWGVELDEFDVSYVVRYGLSGGEVC